MRNRPSFANLRISLKGYEAAAEIAYDGRRNREAMVRGQLVARRLGIAFSAVLLALLVTPTASSGPADNQCWEYSKAETRFKNKINKERLEVDALKLKIDPELSKVARKHTKEMIQANKEDPSTGLFHSTDEQLAKRITNWLLLGENVGVGGDVTSLHDAFMASPPHAHNVLNPAYKHVGVGVKHYDGRMWVTIIFEANDDPGTTLQMPSC